MTDTSQVSNHLILLGTGQAHIRLLSNWGKRPLPGVQITLIAPCAQPLHANMVPGLVAGHYAQDDCTFPLEALLKNTGVRWLTCQASGLDANARTLTLDDGSTLGFSWLSVNTGPVQSRQLMEQTMPGAQEHGLFTSPPETFAALWPRVTALAQTRALRIAIIGGGAQGAELAMAIKFRLTQSSVTLITGEPGMDSNPLQQRVLSALRQRHITVLTEQVTGIEPDQILLASGARLACDVPILAATDHTPSWLKNSGLALDEQGSIAVDAHLRATRHPHVFVIGALSATELAQDLAAVVAGLTPRPRKLPTNTLNLLACGNAFALASWGRHSAQGRWVWWLKDWMDRSFMQRIRKA